MQNTYIKLYLGSGQVMEILMKRKGPKPLITSEFLQCDEVRCAFRDQDVKEAENGEKMADDWKKSTEGFQRRVRQLYDKVFPPPPPPGAGGKGKRARGRGASDRGIG